MKIRLKHYFILIFVIASCTPQKKLIYLHNAETGIHQSNRKFVYTLRSGDVLQLNIFSADENLGNMFNSHRARSSTVDPSILIYGYQVSDSGFVNLPLIGKLHVSGLTIEQASERIELLLKEYYFDVIVDVKLINFRITVLGEVRNPGSFTTFNPKINILEAIALSGDLNEYGKRDVTLIRHSENGYEIFKVDLKDKNLMNHECFYLLPNDIIYVEPHKAKMFGFNTFPLATLFSTVSTLILILRFIE